MDDKEKDTWIKIIDNMNRLELAALYRFAPSGHPIFTRGNGIFEHFNKRFQGFGGMSVAISKKIGW